jgi:galactose oxidase
MRRVTLGSRLLIAGATVLAAAGVVAGYATDGAHPHDAGDHRHVAPGDIQDVAADPTLSRAGWTAVADSAHDGYPAGNVLDGNLDSIWHTPYGPGATPLPHTVTLDMKVNNVVSALRYLPRPGTNRGGTIGGYQIHVSADGATWGNPVATGTFADDAAEKMVPFPAVTARFVRLTATTEAGNRGPWATAAEINLNGNVAPTLSRAGWTAAADSAHDGYPAGNVLDGNLDSIWHTPYGPGATPLPHTVTLDMKTSNVVSALRYLPRPGTNRGGTIGGYQIHVSADGATWGNPVATGTFSDNAAEKIVPFTPKTGRYVRLTATTEAGNRGPWSSAAEINVNGKPSPTLDRTGWTVTADSQETRSANNWASNVLDGDLGTIWHTKYLGTVAPLPHVITIDTKASKVVSGLRYQPRLGANRNGTIGGFQIHVSADGATWGSPVASGTWADNEAEKVALFTPKTARYVRLTATTEAGNRGQWTTAAEINLVGDQPKLNPGVAGSWGATVGFPLVPVAVAQLPNGNVLTWAAADPYTSEPLGEGLTQTATYNVASGTVSHRTVAETDHDMFCPGTAALPDGRIMISGGSNAQKTTFYNPANDTWTSGADMTIPRGYQTSLTLSDGRVFTLGGSWSGGEGGKDAEVWSANEGWRTLPGVTAAPILTADPEGVYRSDNHAWLFAASNGRVFHAGPSKQMNWFDANGNGTQSSAGTRGDDQDAMNGDAVMYAPGKILTSGGAPAYGNSNATNNAYTIDINSGVTVTKVAPMAYRRAFHNSVVLPDGKVLVVGGQSYALPYTDTTSIMPAELWNPATNSFTTMAAMNVPRNYHSVALLLPDGRVFTGGGGLCGNCTTNHPDAQVFSPPYLFAADGSPAPRPAITSAPGTAGTGSSITVATDRTVSAFSLVRMGAVTHNINTDQRRIPLTATSVNGTSYTLAVPADRGTVVPGYYMLFAMDANGVPSVAKTVQIS